MIAVDEGRYDEALSLLHENTRIFRDVGDVLAITVNLGRVAYALAFIDRHADAARLLAFVDAPFAGKIRLRRGSCECSTRHVSGSVTARQRGAQNKRRLPRNALQSTAPPRSRSTAPEAASRRPLQELRQSSAPTDVTASLRRTARQVLPDLCVFAFADLTPLPSRAGRLQEWRSYPRSGLRSGR